MDAKQSSQISELLNSRNKLVRKYAPEDIYKARESYLFELSEDGSVIGCVEVKRVQWYQFEINHLCVKKDVEGKGIGWTLLKRAETVARNAHACVLQCTIREDNKPSRDLFERNGFMRVSGFHYPASGNNVDIFQKIISKER